MLAALRASLANVRSCVQSMLSRLLCDPACIAGAEPRNSNPAGDVFSLNFSSAYPHQTPQERRAARDARLSLIRELLLHKANINASRFNDPEVRAR